MAKIAWSLADAAAIICRAKLAVMVTNVPSIVFHSPEGFADTMKEIGEDLRYSTRQRFITGIAPDGSRWQPPAAAALALRAKRGRSGTKPLVDTGTLKGSVSYSATGDGLVIAVNREFAHVHQFGTNRAGRGRKATIPKRPFLGLSEADYRRLAIKCPRCGTLNLLKAASLPSERPGASPRKETYRDASSPDL